MVHTQGDPKNLARQITTYISIVTCSHSITQISVYVLNNPLHHPGRWWGQLKAQRVSHWSHLNHLLLHRARSSKMLYMLMPAHLYSCIICQRVGKSGHPTKALLVHFSIIDETVKRIYVGIIGL